MFQVPWKHLPRERKREKKRERERERERGELANSFSSERDPKGRKQVCQAKK